MKYNFIFRGLSLLAFALLVQSCKDEPTVPTPTNAYGTGVFVINEGPFQNGSGTVTFINRSTSGVQQDVFQQANGRPLGNIAQSMASFGTQGLIVVNNANKVEVVDLKDFKSVGSIEGLGLPSKIVVAGNTGKAYVTEWVSFGSPGRVAVINISSRSVLRSIPVGDFPNAITFHNNRIYVANSNENTVTEINTNVDTVLRTITVGDRPNGFVSIGNDLLVLCGGNPSWTGTETVGSIASINGAQTSISNFPDPSFHPSNFSIHPNGTAVLYEINGAVYSQNLPLPTSIMPANSVINRSFYHFSLDPTTDGLLYGTDAGDFASNGWIFRYERNFVLKDSIRAGIAPGYIHYR
jgi:YVTN family beta-propeller protein